MGVTDLEARFKHLLADPGTVAAHIKDALVEAATKINDAVEESPWLLNVLQHLEQAVHIAVISPHFQQPLDPTPAGQREPAQEPPSSPPPSSTGIPPASSTASEG